MAPLRASSSQCSVWYSATPACIIPSKQYKLATVTQHTISTYWTTTMSLYIRLNSNKQLTDVTFSWSFHQSQCTCLHAQIVIRDAKLENLRNLGKSPTSHCLKEVYG
ncbi:hypothetical protein T4D_6934 [Trichinella pseudospiralis]|uniref:Uncharacterized protein n=1 Tax=Trichinella pseudospiralis TaxID=6337 RepID=A0A0V1FDJ7_TRIPS|nr:hypothetical protein T4D_6934 [Trichinella pseudospiralis]